MGVFEGYRRGYGSYRRKPRRVLRVIKGYTVGDNTGRQPEGSDGGYRSYGSYRRDFPSVMRVIPVNNSHNPPVTPITLENPARNSCNPRCITLEIASKEEDCVFLFFLWIFLCDLDYSQQWLMFSRHHIQCLDQVQQA